MQIYIFFQVLSLQLLRLAIMEVTVFRARLLMISIVTIEKYS